MEAKPSFTVLIAYNDDDITKLVTTIINTKYNAHIDVAKNVGEFLFYTDSKKYDIIFINYLFSKNVFYMIESFRKRTKGSIVPIVLFISYITETEYLKAARLDVYDFLSKPFSLDQIYSTIECVLREKTYDERIKNRRRFERINKTLHVKYKKDGYISPVFTTKDISVDGLQLLGKNGIMKDDDIDLEIIIDNSGEGGTVDANGNVRWVTKTRQATFAGISFNIENVSDRLRLLNALYVT